MKPSTLSDVWKKLHNEGYNVYSGNIVYNVILYKILKYLNKSQTILDIGCGNGDVFDWIRKHIDKYIGVDISEKACQTLIERFKGDKQLTAVSPVSGDGTLSVFSDKTFDAVFSCLVLQHIHIKFVEKYIEESYRILKDEGLIIFHCTEWLNRSKDEKEIINTDMSYQLQYDYVTGGTYSHTRDIMGPLFNKHGFDLIDFIKNDHNADLKNVGADWIVYVARKRK